MGFFFRHGLHGKHRFSLFFSVKSAKSVPKRNHQMYFDTSHIYTIGLLFFSLHILQYISRLAIQYLANSFQCGETDSLCLTGLQNRKIRRRNVNLLRQLPQRYFSSGHHNVKVYYNHFLFPNIRLNSQVLFFFHLQSYCEYLGHNQCRNS